MKTNIKTIIKSTLLISITALCAMFYVASSHAGEPYFGTVYLAETLPAGGLEAEQWVTFREKKSQGTYRLQQYRTEIEYGITDRWMAALYLNSYSVTAARNNSNASRNNYTVIGDGDEVSGGGPVTFGPYVPNADKLPLPSSRYSKAAFDSVSIETIYQFMSPYKDAFGLAGYLEYTHGQRVRELELKLLVQKNLLDDALVLAGNIAMEFERENYSLTGFEKEAKLTFSAGASYKFAPKWRAGFELINERGYKGHSFSSGARDYSAWFAGPSLNYAAGKWFATVTYLGQLPLASAYGAASQVELVNSKVYKSTEKHNLRVKIGYTF